MTVRKWEVVVLALADAGGLGHSVDTEDVAVAASKLSQEAFSWRKYPEQIDLDSVRVSLTDACKDKYGGLVGGSVGQGWHITERGAEWLQTYGPTRRTELGVAGPGKRLDARLESAHVGREAARVKSSRAFRQWREAGEVSTRDAAAVFRIDRYTNPRDRTFKIRRVSTALDEFGDTELIDFIKAAAREAERMPGIEPVADLVDEQEKEM